MKIDTSNTKITGLKDNNSEDGMSKKELESLIKKYDDLKAVKSKYTSLWDDISKYVSIYTQDSDLTNQGSEAEQIDVELNDATAMISATQSADSLFGIIWGENSNVFELKPSDELIQEIGDNSTAVNNWFEYATKRLLSDINHSKANFSGSKQSEIFEKITLGTSAIGCFLNEGYLNGRSNNPLEFRSYSIKSLTIDEGSNGIIDTVFLDFRWRVNRIVKTFCMGEGGVDKEKLNNLPKDIISAWERDDVNKEFDIVCGIMPQDSFKKGVEGKMGSEYIAIWFTKSPKHQFAIEYHKKMPVIVSRSIVLSGEVYGRGYGTSLIGSIKTLNYIMGDALEALEKSVRSSMGVIQGGLLGDNVIDMSAGTVNVFKDTGGKTPIFPISDVKDVSALVNFLIPYLKEQITTAFKTDVLLDFNSSKQMTATESNQRMLLRSQSLKGLLTKEKNESLLPLIDTAISLELQAGRLGFKSVEEEEKVFLISKNLENTIIPMEVLSFMKTGREWYKVVFKNELAKLESTDKLNSITQLLQYLEAIVNLNPQMAQAIKPQEILSDINNILNNPSDYLLTKKEYSDMISAMQEKAATQSGVETAEKISNVSKNMGGNNGQQKGI